MIFRWNKVILSRLCQISHHNLGRNFPPTKKENTINLCFHLFFFLKKNNPQIPQLRPLGHFLKTLHPCEFLWSWIWIETLGWLRPDATRLPFIYCSPFCVKYQKQTNNPQQRRKEKHFLQYVLCQMQFWNQTLSAFQLGDFFLNFPPVTNLLWN